MKLFFILFIISLNANALQRTGFFSQNFRPNLFIASQNTFTVRTNIYIPDDPSYVIRPIGTSFNIVNNCFAPGANDARTLIHKYYCNPMPSFTGASTPTPKYDDSTTTCPSNKSLTTWDLGSSVTNDSNWALIRSANCILVESY